MLTLAWRNLWRNKRRTVITAASVCFAVFFSILIRGFHIGSWSELIDSVLHSYTGYIQIHARGYWENKTLDYTISEHDKSIANIRGIQQINGLIPRFESFALASSTEKVKAVIVVGINPEQEKAFSRLNDRVVEGNFITSDEKSILISQRLAEFLKIRTGDSLVLISQGYQGSSAAGLFRVSGIVKLPSPEFDNQMIFMPLSLAQEFYSAPGLITSWVVDITNNELMKKTVAQISDQLPHEKYEVMSWHEMLPELYQQYVSDEGGALIILALLYLIVGFGIFGTVMMMLAERKYEMGIMVALGMNKIRLSALMAAELFYICLIGLIAGVIISLPFLYYYHVHPITFSGEMAKVYMAFGMEPILPVAWQADYIFQQVINVFIITCLALIYPFYLLFRFNLITALKR